MPKTIKIGIEPSVLAWARTSIGLTVDDVVLHFGKASFRRFKVDKDFIEAVEKEKQEISFTLIKEFAKLYKRPLSAFFISRPPKEKPLPKDFRTISSEVNKQLTKNTMLMIRRVRRVQMVTKELYEDLGIEYKFKFKKYSLEDGPDNLARLIRDKFGFTLDKQKSMKDTGELFEYLRNIIEESGVIVLKGSFPLEDARAFSFVDEKPYVIVINNKDGNDYGYAPKVFSLMHEFAHILLRESSICNDFAYSHIKMEKFCNQFAGEFLIPREQLLEVLPVQLKEKISKDNINDFVKELKAIFKTSGHVALRRMFALDYINKAFYEKTLDTWKEEYDEKIKQSKSGKEWVPIISQDRKALNNYGKHFTKLVLEAQFADKITLSSAAEYLSIKAKHMPDLYSLALKKI